MGRRPAGPPKVRDKAKFGVTLDSSGKEEGWLDVSSDARKCRAERSAVASHLIRGRVGVARGADVFQVFIRKLARVRFERGVGDAGV